MTAPDTYGMRNVPDMIRQMEDLRRIIRAQGTPAVQEAWDKVEEHIDYAYRAMPARPAAPQDPRVPDLQAKIQKQRNEIGRLTHQVAALEGDKRDLRFDLFKAQARSAQVKQE
ncbi:hypothetical protein UFOVP16_13 [uncultured Caudovirales phage]|uniref:Uncharacterized protein n=1 Tax=uncultured Caudovirales phage TaxID=2100421 RepID=A0A6J5KNS7_9CAUD|nr:hypothetical protein UFOVP16_13 [uncultured Caudovirales phage]